MPLPPLLSDAFTFDTLSVPAMLIDPDGSILAANAASCQATGRSAEELIGMTITQLAAVAGARWAELVAQARSEGTAVDETVYLTPAGDTRYFKYMVARLDAGGREVIQVISFDITKRRLAEDAARQRSTADQRTAAEQRLESLGLVAGGIAHDFNNLLVGVLAEASAAREDQGLTPNASEALRRIEAAARRMAQLTRQLLAFAGRGKLVTVPVDADALVVELREQLARLVRPGIDLAIKAASSERPVVDADAGLLRQVVINLVANASDARSQQITLTTNLISRDGAAWWQLEVADDGEGIEPATLGRIFEPFFSTKSDRHGLGLSAVHGIVRRLNGEIEVDSQPGQGTRFRVRLPVVVGAEPAPRKSSDYIGMTPLRLAGVHVLVADDEPSVRATVRRLLERRGATVVLAVDGLEAEARLRAESFGLIVLDVMMPGRTGHEVLVTARAEQPTTPVVLMSGYTEKIRGEGSEEEADAFLEKPFTAKALDETIDRVLKHR
ncbi:MAG: response regulator [Deltaproteobacteria bacterium]|nr:response regulator [Deltaproteobacteria bacterium]MDQ3301131.1 ATP-binding protein [Myxococcota bacterium]